MPEDSGEVTAATPPARLREVAAAFTRLGFIAFGGPAAHLGLMEDEFVQRRKWLDREHFLDLASAVNFIPGPNSTELAIHLGLIRAGFPGMVLAGVCFITPAVLIILPIAFVYVKYGSLPQVAPAMRGVSIAVTAIVITATWRLLKSHRRDAWNVGLIAFSAIAWFVLRRLNVPQPDLIILVMAGTAGVVRRWFRRNFHLRLPCLLPLAILNFDPGGLGQMTLFFLKIGATLFGSGYVLVTYLQTGLVDDKHWLTQQQMLDAIAVGQFTPGPLLTTATFIGYVLGSTRFGNSPLDGAIFAVAATVSIFLPSFLLITVLAPALQRIRSFESSSGVFDSLHDAVIGLLVATSSQLISLEVGQTTSAQVLCLHMTLLAILVCMLLCGMNGTWIILASGIVGFLVLR
jgi:chromate transporter